MKGAAKVPRGYAEAPGNPRVSQGVQEMAPCPRSLETYQV